ncbi:platelet glycoprotein V-like [Bradysia coprophila]|uniref:platelet glycoprotein V-like n=1 Tax=Bradysia coprophila TaxID=38358 RepID=UPI00187DB6CF|nr:platelet glycoprotein V-like [Bradysia coprophila]
MLYENNINIVDADVFATVSNLNFLRFSDNIIQHFPSHFNITSKNFRYFQLFGHHTSIPDEMLSNLPVLRDVDIRCNLESVPENLFKGSYNLNIVNLTGNRLTDLPENLLANQTALFHLYLDKNRFEVLPENLIKNLMTKPTWVSQVLFVFSFKSNRIQSISEDDWKWLLGKDGEYNFSDNLLSDFSVFNNIGDTFVHSKSFFIFNDNPIICDCEKIASLRNYLKNEKRIWRFSYESNDAKCASPADLQGIEVADVQCN